MISSGACGREPELRIAPGKHILLQPERGHIQAMDHVLARHRKPHGIAYRHMQHIDFRLPIGMLELPHPLLGDDADRQRAFGRSEEHTSELQSLMRISYAVFCLQKKKRIATLTKRTSH